VGQVPAAAASAVLLRAAEALPLLLLLLAAPLMTCKEVRKVDEVATSSASGLASSAACLLAHWSLTCAQLKHWLLRCSLNTEQHGMLGN
jgi:hypothetical protein